MTDRGTSRPRPPPDRPTRASPPSSARRTTTVWQVLTAVFAIAAVALAIWVFMLYNDARSDEDIATSEITSLQTEVDGLTEQVSALEDENATLAQDNAALRDEIAAVEEDNAALEDENAGLQRQSQQLSQEAQQAIDQAVAALEILADERQIGDQQVADSTAALQAANDALADARGDLETAVAERDQAVALAETARTCASGAMTAVGQLGEGDIDGAAEAALEAAAAGYTLALTTSLAPLLADTVMAAAPQGSAELPPAGVQRARATAGDEREVARVVAARQRHQAQRAGHAVVGDAHHGRGGALGVEAQTFPQRMREDRAHRVQ